MFPHMHLVSLTNKQADVSACVLGLIEQQAFSQSTDKALTAQVLIARDHLTNSFVTQMLLSRFELINTEQGLSTSPESARQFIE